MGSKDGTRKLLILHILAVMVMVFIAGSAIYTAVTGQSLYTKDEDYTDIGLVINYVWAAGAIGLVVWWVRMTRDIWRSRREED